MEVREPGYTALTDCADPSDPDLFRGVNLSFDIAKDEEIEGRTKVDFFQAVSQTLKRNEALEAADRDELYWKKDHLQSFRRSAG